MTDMLTGDARVPAEESNQSALSWAAIFAGAISNGALTLLLVAFGSGIGFSSVSPWPNSGMSLTSFQIATGLYLIFVAILSSTIGGYLAGRLRTKWVGLRTEEVLFRDTAHGFASWALAAVAGAAAFGAAAMYVAGGAAEGASRGASQAAAQSASPSMGYFADLMLRPGPGAAPASTSNEAANAPAEVGRVLAHGMSRGGEISQVDRAYLAQVVAARTGLSQADAEKRVAVVIDEARTAADQARKAAAAFSLWLAASMLVGAFSASLAAIEGGQLRDGRWRGVIGARSYAAASRV
jgi:hypothetical protein